MKTFSFEIEIIESTLHQVVVDSAQTLEEARYHAKNGEWVQSEALESTQVLARIVTRELGCGE